MKTKNLKFNKGFVILFVVVLSSIILAITLSVANISLKEINFSTSAKDTNDAFFAADTGAECALFYDKTIQNAFSDPGLSPITCNSVNMTVNSNPPPPDIPTTWEFVIIGLGSAGKGCATVSVDKTDPLVTRIVSKGLNNAQFVGSGTDYSCLPVTNTVERQLEINY